MDLAGIFDEVDRRLRIKKKVTRDTLTEVMVEMVLEQYIVDNKPSSEGFEGQASGCDSAEKPRDEGS